MVIHSEKSNLADKKIKLKKRAVSLGNQYMTIIDWYDRLVDDSWKENIDNNVECKIYNIRRENSKHIKMPYDDEVLKGYIDDLSFLIHINEIENE